jgi:hypothetical protein
MHVRMVLKVLTPSVEDGQEADLSPEVLGIAGDLPFKRPKFPESQRRRCHRCALAADQSAVFAGDVASAVLL